MKTTAAHSAIGWAGSLATVWFTISGFETTVRILGEVGAVIVTTLTIVSMIRKMRADATKGRK